MMKIFLNETELREKYVNEKMGVREAAKHFGVSVPTIQNNMKHYGIKARTSQEHNKGRVPVNAFQKGHKAYNRAIIPNDEIVRMYVVENKSSVEIGKTFDVSHKTILNRLKECGIPLKDSGHFKKGKKATEETKALLSEMRKGKPQPQLQTKEARKKMSKSLKELHKKKEFGWSATARKMRSNGGTDAELYLEHLLTINGVSGFEREYIIPVPGKKGRFSIDFANPVLKIAVELDGDSHKRRKDHDEKRDAFLNDLGWEVIRFTNKELFFNPTTVIETITKAANFI